MATHSDLFVKDVQDAAGQFLDALATLLSSQKEWTALDYGTTLTFPTIDPSTASLLPADIAAVIFTSANAIDALMQQGHYTNLYKVRK